MKMLLYCTKAKPYLIHESGCYDSDDMCCDYNRFSVVDRQELYNQDISLNETYNGKIVGECDFEVEEIKKVNYDCMLFTNTLDTKKLITESCIDYFELEEYLKPNWDKEDDLQNLDTVGYAIHISNLNIFYTPKELSDYYSIIDMGGGMLGTKPLTKAPQNMMHISINLWEYCFYNPNDINILISINPEWLCKILNGEKTIEVRKKVLRRMI